MSKLSDTANKFKSKDTIKSLSNLANRFLNKFAENILTPAILEDKIIKATSALFLNAGGGGFEKISAVPQTQPDGKISYTIYITLVNHNLAMPKLGEELNRKILDTLELAYPDTSFNIVYS